MTVTVDEARIEYAGNGVTTVFAYPYEFYENSDLEIWLFTDATGDGVQLTLNVDYTVTGAMDASGGNVTTSTPPPGGTTLIIINNPDITQLTHYVNADDFPAESHEAALDRLTKICQRLSDRVDRCVRSPDYAPIDSVPDADEFVGLVVSAEAAAVAAAASADAAAASAASADADAGDADADAAAASAAANDAEAAAAAAAASALDAEVHKIVWRGNWSASVSYQPSDAVFLAGTSYISKTSNIGHQPDTSPADWDLLAKKGDPGPVGSGAGDMLRSANLSDVLSIATARANLALGNSAVLNVGATPNTVAAGDDPRFKVVYVSDTPPVGAADGTLWWESDSGLLFIRYNDGDSSQWVIASPQPDISVFAPLDSPVFTGNPQAPTPAPGDNDTSIATTGFVKAANDAVVAGLVTVYAPLASPNFSGTPALAGAPLATQGWVNGVLGSYVTSASLSVTLTGYATQTWVNTALGGYATTGTATSLQSQINSHDARIASLEAWRASSGGGSSCFLAGTKVAMADGTFKAIENVEVDDIVLSNYHKPARVIALNRPMLGNRRLMTVGTLSGTPEHLFFSKSNPVVFDLEGYRRETGKPQPYTDAEGVTRFVNYPGIGGVEEIDSGMLTTIDGEAFVVPSFSEAPRTTQLFNLAVDGSHTYYAEGFLVGGWERDDDFDYLTWEPAHGS